MCVAYGGVAFCNSAVQHVNAADAEFIRRCVLRFSGALTDNLLPQLCVRVSRDSFRMLFFFKVVCLHASGLMFKHTGLLVLTVHREGCLRAP